MKTGTPFVLGALVIAAGAFFLLRGDSPDVAPDRGPAGIEFVVPEGYAVVRLGESTLSRAAKRLRAEVTGRDRVAAVFTRRGDLVQVLVDVPGDEIVEQISGRQGTVKTVAWAGGLSERLRWAEEQGDFAAPDLPPARERNAYH